MDKHLEEWIERQYLKEMEIGKKLLEKERSKSLSDTISDFFIKIMTPIFCSVALVALLIIIFSFITSMTSEDKPFAIECAINQTLPQKLSMECHSNTAIKIRTE